MLSKYPNPITPVSYSTVFAFLRRDILNEISYKLSFFLQLFGIFPVVVMFFFLSKLVGNTISGPLSTYGGGYFPFVLIGIAVQNYLTLSLSSFSSSLRESQLSGTLEAVLATPVSLPAFLAGSTIYSFVLNAFRILIYLGLGSLLFQVHFNWTRLPAALGVICLTIAAFSALGIFSAGFIMLFKKGDPVNWTFNVLSWLLGGVYYPVSVLPDWLQDLAFFIPMTHALEALRQVLLTDQGLSGVSGNLLVLGMWGLIGLPISFGCFKWALNRARKMGTLGHY